MNFKKLALLATLAASSSAFALTDLDVAPYADAAATNDYAVAEFAAAGTSSGDGNFVIISQVGGANLAFIDQAGATNFATIAQASDANIAVIYQVGDSNRAAVYQH